MKLKKAMKKFDITVVPETRCEYRHYKLGNRLIVNRHGKWESDYKYFESESEAVAWLIEGAEPKPKKKKWRPLSNRSAPSLDKTDLDGLIKNDNERLIITRKDGIFFIDIQTIEPLNESQVK
jgi:hypothetical protein